MLHRDLLKLLQKGLTSLGERCESHPCEAYLYYLQLLSKWNKAYNLTAIRDMEKMLTHHILDSLVVLPYIHGTECLDVGSGAGLPGLILALARPEQNWILLDSNKKKLRFINQAVLEMDLNNIKVIHSRIEDYQPQQRFSTIISRALGSVPVFYKQTLSLLQEQGRIIAMKGLKPVQELKQLKESRIAYNLCALKIPDIEDQRHLILIDVNQE